MEGPKKRVAKYGKAGRRALVHDLFDVASQQKASYTTPQDAPFDQEVHSRGATPSSHASDDIETGQQLKSELLATWGTDKPRLKSPVRKSTTMRPTGAATMFEIESSEEEKTPKSKPQPKTYKRRKITPTHSDAETKDRRGRSREPMAASDPNVKTKDATQGVAQGIGFSFDRGQSQCTRSSNYWRDILCSTVTYKAPYH